MDLTGERWIPGKSDPRVEADHTARYQFAAAHARGSDVLDIACGAGAGSHWLASRAGAKTVVGVEVDEEAVEYARANFSLPNVTFERGDLTALRFRECFDLVVCFETIEHVVDDRAALRALSQALRPGGRLILSTPNRFVTSPRADSISDKPENPFHVREYVLSELVGVISSAGLVVAETAGQRFRARLPSGTLNGWIDNARRRLGRNPDFDSSPAVGARPGFWSQARNWVLVCQRP